MILLLAFIVFVLYVIFSIGHLCASRAANVIPPGPLDPEDRILIEKEHVRSSRFAFVKSPYDAFSRYTEQVAFSGAHKGRSNRSLPYSGTKLVSITSPQGTTPSLPPPAYKSPSPSSIPHWSAPHWSDSYSFPDTHKTPLNPCAIPKRRFAAIPKLRIRKTIPPSVSKPIMHPEEPLPGPPIESEYLKSQSATLKPCIAPRSMYNHVVHPPAIYLPSPSQAYVFNNRDSPSVREKNKHFLSVGGPSASSGPPKLDLAFASYNIGLAF